MDPRGRSTWGSSTIPSATDYKPGGTGIVSFGDHSGRIKETGNDRYNRWLYQIIDGKNNIDMLIISIYQCCKIPTNKLGSTAFHQQKIQFIDEGREDLDPGKHCQMIFKFFLSRRNLKTTKTEFRGSWETGMKKAQAIPLPTSCAIVLDP